MIGVLAADLGQRVVRHPHQLRRLVRRADQLGRRIGQRQHMLRAGKFVHQRAASIDVPQRLEPRESRQHRMAGNEVAQAIEIRLGHEVVENVDHHAAQPSPEMRRGKEGSAAYLRTAAGSCYPDRQSIKLRLAGYQPASSIHTRALHRLAEVAAPSTSVQRIEIALIDNITAAGRRADDLLAMTEGDDLDHLLFLVELSGGARAVARDVRPALPLRRAPNRLCRARRRDRPIRSREDVASATGFRVLGFWDNGFRHISNAPPSDPPAGRLRRVCASAR